MNRTTGFDRNTKAEEVLAGIDLFGKTYLVTGASSGLGQEAARMLASRRAKIVMAVRSREKGEAAAAAIRQSVPAADLDVRLVDLASTPKDALVKPHNPMDFAERLGFHRQARGPEDYGA